MTVSRFVLAADVDTARYVQATYMIRGAREDQILAMAERFAVGQTVGTWVDVPHADAELFSRYGGKVVSIFAAPPSDSSEHADPPVGHVVTIALPAENFGAQFPMMLTTLLGNDASTSISARLIDVTLPPALESAFGGPRFGIGGVRALVGVMDRPLILNMVKPCVGLPAAVGARIAKDAASGGVDLIKDDELLASPAYSPIAERVREYNRALSEVTEETGHRAVYVPNITDRPARMRENAKAALGEGASALMVNYAAVGLGAVQDLAEEVGVPLLGHLATAAISFEGPDSGMSAAIAWGLFPRLAGVDMAIITTRKSGYPVSDLASARAVHQLALPHPRLRQTMPIIGGGVHPGAVAEYVRRFGKDIILGVGGAIQGHPRGSAAGARAVRAAVDATLDGVALRTAAQASEDLRLAIDAWGSD